MNPRQPKEPIKPSMTFVCCGKEISTVQEMKDHLASAHNVTEFKGTRKMTSHLDCADSYHSQYEWTVGGVTFQQSTSNPRH